MEQFDGIVIGTNSAGGALAGRCADEGLHVALVEAALWGPRASNWTCVPSSLVRSGDVSPRPTATGRELGLTGHIDVQAALAQRDYVTSKWHDEGQLPWLKEHKITLVSGSGRLDGRQTISSAKERRNRGPRRP
jgi:pyruvate/2-oxoglutarate dehydrogenase complex dihydrolipoamide dehydrogenase (E3) component